MSCLLNAVGHHQVTEGHALRMLQSPEPALRRQALYLLDEMRRQGKQSAPDGVAPFRAALADPKEPVRTSATVLLRAAARAQPEKARAFLPDLAAERAEVRVAAAAVLAEAANARPAALAADLLACLEPDRKQEERVLALAILSALADARPEGATAALVALLPQPGAHGDRRAPAAFVLNRIAQVHPEAAVGMVDPLLAAFNNGDDRVREAAAYTLERVAPASAATAQKTVARLLPVLRDRKPLTSLTQQVARTLLAVAEKQTQHRAAVQPAVQRYLAAEDTDSLEAGAAPLRDAALADRSAAKLLARLRSGEAYESAVLRRNLALALGDLLENDAFAPEGQHALRAELEKLRDDGQAPPPWRIAAWDALGYGLGRRHVRRP
jgi:hypothetical protein